jgi:cell filamentation protein
MERQLVIVRSREGIPDGDFDLDHLRHIHRHLFQDVYDWAGELRTLEISKGGEPFQLRGFIETGMADVHRRLVAGRYLHGQVREEFAASAAEIIGDINFIHPFREGNGRTQLNYLKKLAMRAGHPIRLARLRSQEWIEASQASRRLQNADYSLMAMEIRRALSGPS